MTDLFLLAVLPYVCVAISVAGLAWRFAGPRTITTRSSQFLEGRALFWGSVPWHYAVLAILAAHLAGVLFPGATGALLGEPARLALAEMTGLALGVWALVGVSVLAIRRAANPRLRAVTTASDVFVLALLLVQVATGVWVAATLRWGSVWYLHTAAPWLASLARLDPKPEYAALLPPVVKLHALAAFVLLAFAPFSRLVHAAAAPVQYLWRPPQLVVWNRRLDGGASGSPVPPARSGRDPTGPSLRS
jgi:nitrate reductase gamma subunit